jgi:16S rRNA (guanine966-N2)-methyltransferase
MRVIAGTAKGRGLVSVPGDSTRPITDRVKAALFSILHSQEMIEDRRYLDLFGGTGAVGIEALSRGAAEAVFCERDRLALKTLRRNLEATGLAEQAIVVPGDAFAYLQRSGLAPFDVIYIAPPQYQGLWLRALQMVDARPELLTADGIAILQVFPKEWSAPALSHLTLFDQRRYGSTELFFLAPGARERSASEDADSSDLTDFEDAPDGSPA